MSVFRSGVSGAESGAHWEADSADTRGQATYDNADAPRGSHQPGESGSVAIGPKQSGPGRRLPLLSFIVPPPPTQNQQRKTNVAPNPSHGAPCLHPARLPRPRASSLRSGPAWSPFLHCEVAPRPCLPSALCQAQPRRPSRCCSNSSHTQPVLVCLSPRADSVHRACGKENVPRTLQYWLEVKICRHALPEVLRKTRTLLSVSLPVDLKIRRLENLGGERTRKQKRRPSLITRQ